MADNKATNGQNNNLVSDPAIGGIDNQASTENNTNSVSNNTITAPNKPKYNVQNLKPFNKTDNIISSEEAKRRGSIGGQKSAEVRKQRKTMKDTLNAILSREISTKVLDDNGVDIESLNGDYTALNVLLTQIVAEGIANRDYRAATFIRDTIGEAPVQKQEIQQEIITKDDIDLMDNVRKQLLSS